MKDFKYIWVFGLVATLLIVIVPIVLFVSGEAEGGGGDPWEFLPQRVPHVDHTELMKGPYESGSDVTRACLECHETAAHEVAQTVHWTWESEPFDLPWRDEPTTIGKINQINNFCIGTQGNTKKCMTCHTGIGRLIDA